MDRGEEEEVTGIVIGKDTFILGSGKKPEDQHEGYIRCSIIRGIHAKCTCGWKGDVRRTTREAGHDILRHYDETGRGWGKE